jgi:hypothetical protein
MISSGYRAAPDGRGVHLPRRCVMPGMMCVTRPGIEGSARICSRVVVSVCAVMSPASSHMRAGVCHFVRRGGSQKIIGTGRSAMTSRTGSGSGLSVLPSFSQPRIGKCPLLVDRPDLVRRRVVKSLH